MNNSVNSSNLTGVDLEQVKQVLDLYTGDNNVLWEPFYTLVIVAYTVLVTVAGFGNSAVILVVLRRKEMRTARNIFIFNLALSDLLMTTSIPFTVIDILTRAWKLPEYVFACRYKCHPYEILFMSLKTS